MLGQLDDQVSLFTPKTPSVQCEAWRETSTIVYFRKMHSSTRPIEVESLKVEREQPPAIEAKARLELKLKRLRSFS
jgi:hypothetical protein